MSLSLSRSPLHRGTDLKLPFLLLHSLTLQPNNRWLWFKGLHDCPLSLSLAVFVYVWWPPKRASREVGPRSCHEGFEEGEALTWTLTDPLAKLNRVKGRKKQMSVSSSSLARCDERRQKRSLSVRLFHRSGHLSWGGADRRERERAHERWNDVDLWQLQLLFAAEATCRQWLNISDVELNVTRTFSHFKGRWCLPLDCLVIFHMFAKQWLRRLIAWKHHKTIRFQ